MRGKGGRVDRLPMPADVGEAIASYLRRGRPASDRREVFLRARAPFAPIAPGTVSSTVRRACRRAGIAEVGSHRLRHTRPARWSRRTCRCSGSARCCAIAACRAPRSMRASISTQLRLLASAVAEGGSESMSALEQHVDDYLRLRRALGFKLERARADPAAARRLSRGRRREHDHARAGDRVGQAAGRRAPTPLGGAAGGRARVRRLPADDRPGDRDPAARTCSPSATSAPRPTCGRERTSAGCWRRRARCGRRCRRRATRRCSGCSP